MTTRDADIKHLKLVTGEEVICEILDDDPSTIAIRNALVLTSKYTPDGRKYYAFTTFMVYQDTALNVMLLMHDKIVGMAMPTEEMLVQYHYALEDMYESMTKDESIDEDDQFIEEQERQTMMMLDSDGHENITIH